MLRSIPIEEPLKAPAIQPLIQPFQPDPSLVLWLLPQRDDKWYDYSGKDNHGTIHNAVWKPTPAGVGLCFDGTSAYTDHDVGTSLDCTEAFTIKTWVERNSTGTRDAILAKEGNYLLMIEDSDALVVWLTHSGGTNEVLSGSTITDNNWHCAGMTYNKDIASNNIKLYLDGVIDAQADLTSALDVSVNSLKLGLVNPTWGKPGYIDGIIGEAMIHSRAWSAAEHARTFRAERVRYGV